MKDISERATGQLRLIKKCITFVSAGYEGVGEGSTELIANIQQLWEIETLDENLGNRGFRSEWRDLSYVWE